MIKAGRVIILICLAFGWGMAEEPPLDGGVYQISTASQWKWLVDNNKGDQQMRLVSSFSFDTNGTDYASFASFSGNFNGYTNSITIPDGLTVYNELFGASVVGTVQNLTINLQGMLNDTDNEAGVICRNIGGTIQDVTVNITGRGRVRGGYKAAGFCGSAAGGTLRRCRLVVDEDTKDTIAMTCVDTQWDAIASFIGFQNAPITIENCIAELKKGTMLASTVGGMIAQANYSIVMTLRDTTLVVGTNMIITAVDGGKSYIAGWNNAAGNCSNVNILTPLDYDPLGANRSETYSRFSYNTATNLQPFEVPGTVTPNPLTWTNGIVRAPPVVIDAALSYNSTVYSGVSVAGGVINVAADCSADKNVLITLAATYNTNLPFDLEYLTFKLMPPGTVIYVR